MNLCLALEWHYSVPQLRIVHLLVPPCNYHTTVLSHQPIAYYASSQGALLTETDCFLEILKHFNDIIFMLLLINNQYLISHEKNDFILKLYSTSIGYKGLKLMQPKRWYIICHNCSQFFNSDCTVTLFSLRIYFL